MLTVDRLKEKLSYDPDTGIFTSRKTGKEAGYTDGGYRKISIDGKQYKGHRLAWFCMTGAWPKGDTDHVNGVKTDNSFANLREASRGQNMMNIGLKKQNTSGCKGVSFWKKTGKWKAQIQVNKKKIFLGYHDTVREAYEEFIFAALEHHGEFARFE